MGLGLSRALAEVRRILADMGRGKDVPAGASGTGPGFCQGCEVAAAWLITFSTEAAAAAAARPLGFGAGFIDAQRSAIEVRPV